MKKWTGQDAGCFKPPARLELTLCTIAGGSRGRTSERVKRGRAWRSSLQSLDQNRPGITSHGLTWIRLV